MSFNEIERAEIPKPNNDDDEYISPIEEVRVIVPNDDDPTIPVWTFRMWFLGIISVVLLSFMNTFFGYRREPLTLSTISVLVATLPIGRFMARVLPTRKFRIGSRDFSLNPGPFNMKEHVLISIFANSGAGTAYAIGIINIIRAFYGRKIDFWTSLFLVITTQVYAFRCYLRNATPCQFSYIIFTFNGHVILFNVYHLVYGLVIDYGFGICLLLLLFFFSY